MKITQLRNATVVVEIADEVILVDPMLAPKSAIPALKYATRQRRKNPLVELPEISQALLSRVTRCLITHCQKGHFDHLDRTAVAWLRELNIPVYCSDQDSLYLKNKGLNVQSLTTDSRNPFLQGSIELIPCLHGKGLIGRLMAHGFGYFIQQTGQPSLYISGDTILTQEVRQFIINRQPDALIIPAGGARFDLGGDIIMGVDEAITVGKLSQGMVIANHLEALDHCPVTRAALGLAVHQNDLSHRFKIPGDGESVIIEYPSALAA